MEYLDPPTPLVHQSRSYLDTAAKDLHSYATFSWIRDYLCQAKHLIIMAVIKQPKKLLQVMFYEIDL